MGERIYGLIGRKLGHSWSAPIHHSLGCAEYRLIELEPSALASFLRREDIGGLNVTIPYKVDVLPLCDHIDPAAAAIGSVNTIVRRSDGLHAYNTDAIGFSRMAARTDLSFGGKKVLLLGNGGAARSVRWVCREQGAREVVSVSRSGENNFENLALHADAEIIINATPVGMYPNNGHALLSLADFPRCEGILDLVYNPRRTALLLQAERMGIPCCDGLPMLVEQAVAAEEYFFDKQISPSVSEKILAELRRNFCNLILIGMPGSGKTSVGRRLAEISGRELLELDELIAQRAGRSIPEIFSTGGEEAFRHIESEIVRDAGKQSGNIIVTGGGVVTRDENYAPLHQNGRIYELRRPVALLSREGRPLSQGANLSEMEKIRAPLYTRFRDASVDNLSSVEDCAEMIWRDFFEYTDS